MNKKMEHYSALKRKDIWQCYDMDELGEHFAK
jgi:hypothetical protein